MKRVARHYPFDEILQAVTVVSQIFGKTKRIDFPTDREFDFTTVQRVYHLRG
ncbi:hypothetical protein ACFL3F_03425 [Planctomycetota bacterium]